MFGYRIQSPTADDPWSSSMYEPVDAAQDAFPARENPVPTFQVFAPPEEPQDRRSKDYRHRLEPTPYMPGRVTMPDRDRPRSYVSFRSNDRRASAIGPDASASAPATAAAYHVPPPPALPLPPLKRSHALPRDMDATSHLSVAPPSAIHRSSSLLHKAGKKLSSRWNSTRSTGRDKRLSLTPASGQYGILADTEESDLAKSGARTAPNRRSRSRYKSVQDMDGDDSVEAFGYDLSSLEGPIGLQQMNRINYSKVVDDTGQRQTHDTLVAEFYQLEADGTFTDGLGGGMVAASLPLDASKDALSASGLDVPHLSADGGLSRRITIRDVGRMEAKKLNGMVVVNDTDPTVDISSLDANNRGPGHEPLTAENKNSYYFPPDPEMPNWKPFSMRWPYVTLLILLSLTMAGIQEYLYQLSAHRRPRQEGLLKFISAKELSMWQFFCWKYMATIIAVTYGVLWQIVDFEVKRLEPYYQLSRPEGALAAESLNRDYPTCWPILAPFKALRYRQWAVVYSSTIYLIAAPLVPVLQSASVMVTPDQKERKANEYKYVHMHPVWSRILSTALLIVAILGCLLLVQIRRKSGLLSDPKGIAGVAAMANKSFILMDFKDLDTAPEADIHNRLKHRRYNLHKSSLWQGEYIRFSDKDDEPKKPKNPHPFMLRLTAGIPYIISMLLFMIFIPVLMFVSKVNKIAQGAPWLLTALASIIRVTWSALEGDVRMIEPFYTLSRGNAPSDTLTLDYMGTIPGWLPIKAFAARHYLVGFVGLAAVMTEILTVTVNSLTVRGDTFFLREGRTTGAGTDEGSNSEETFTSVWVSLALTQGILCWLCLIAGLVYHRRRHPFLPRDPGSIASVMAYIHQSKMLVDFVNTELMNSREMTQHLRRKGRTYGLGWFQGRDGQNHCGIDQEPLTTKYVHGVSFHNAVKPWAGTWEPS